MRAPKREGEAKGALAVRSGIESLTWGPASYGYVLGALVLAAVLYGKIDLVVLCAWLLLQAAMLAFTARRLRRLLNEGDSDDLTRIHRGLPIYAAVLGGCWTLPVLLICLYDLPDYLPYAIFVLGGVGVAVAGEQHAHPRATWVQLTLLAVSLVLASIYFGEYLQSALIGFVYLLVLRLASVLNRLFLNTAKLTDERDVLLKDLAESAIALQEANLAKSKFLAYASHDLRQPIHAIGLMMESVADRADGTDVGQVISKTRDSVNTLARLFDSLLDTSMLDSGDVEVRRQTFRVDDLFTQLRADFHSLANDAGLRLSFVASGVWLDSDPVLLRRVIQNLLTNAIRHARSRIVVGVRRRKGVDTSRVDIQVLDDGQGISDLDRDRIFTEFERVAEDRSTAVGSEKAPGLGLGLAIVRRLVELLGLDVFVRSKVGEGSCFVVSGIKVAREEAPLPRIAESRALAPFDQLSVLIVDDDLATLRATATLIEGWGCVPEMSVDGERIDVTPDLVICDYALDDGRTGIDVILEVRGRTSSNVPAIVISGDSTSVVREATQAHELPLLRKPVQPAQLRSAMLSVLASDL